MHYSVGQKGCGHLKGGKGHSVIYFDAVTTADFLDIAVLWLTFGKFNCLYHFFNCNCCIV